MSRLGIVQELRGKYAIISSSRRGICEGCNDKSNCSFDNALGKSVPDLVTAINDIKAKPGDQVEFDLLGHTELKTSLIVWVVPLIGLVLGAIVGSSYHDFFGISSDSGTMFGLAVGLLIGFGSIMLYERKLIDRDKALPVLLNIRQDHNCQEQ